MTSLATAPVDIDANETILEVVIFKLLELLQFWVVLDKLIGDVLLETVLLKVDVHGEVKFLVNLAQL